MNGCHSYILYYIGTECAERNAAIPRKKQKSAKSVKKLRIWIRLSLLVCPFYFPLTKDVYIKGSRSQQRSITDHPPLSDCTETHERFAVNGEIVL